MENKDLMEKLISLCKRRGFIYQGSEIYGGLAGTYDYGPLGVLLKNNIKNTWWKRFVQDRTDMYGIDAAILMNQEVWKASGHVGGFADPLVECKNCKKRYRSDHLIESIIDYKVVKKEFLINLIDQYEQLKKDNVDLLSVIEYAIKIHPDNPENPIKELTEKEKENLNSTISSLMNKLNEAEQNTKSKKEDAEFLDVEIKKSSKALGLITQVYLNRFIKCQNCQARDWTTPIEFNMMFQTNVGAVQDETSVSYLRPETAGGIFVNFKNVLDTFSPRLPFGLAQIGKAFRNEIAPRDFIFRVREFEQMEIEYFVKPGDWEKSFEQLRQEMHSFMSDVGIDKNLVSELPVSDEDRAFYSKKTTDFEFEYPFGKKELYGLAYRTDYDLNAHQVGSKKDLTYFDEDTRERFLPHVVEPSFGVDRTILAVLCSAYKEEKITEDDTRLYLDLPFAVAPYKVCVSPLLKNKEELQEKARAVYATLKKEFGWVMYDDGGNIGKRYRKQDEIGTPYCVVIDFDTTGTGDNVNPEFKDTVTVRDRNTGAQERVSIEKLSEYINTKKSL